MVHVLNAEETNTVMIQQFKLVLISEYASAATLNALQTIWYVGQRDVFNVERIMKDSAKATNPVMPLQILVNVMKIYVHNHLHCANLCLDCALSA